jgi:hypothetical protein
MTGKQFGRLLRKLISETGEFVVDTIDMRVIKADAEKQGFDDVIVVLGKDFDEVFTMPILKVKP